MNRRRTLILLLYLAASIPWIAVGALRALEPSVNSPLDWVTAEFPAKKIYEDFRRQFGPGDAVILSWDGCTIDNEHLDQLLVSLRRSRAFHDENEQPWLTRVVCGREEFLKLTSPPMSLDADAARQRLRGYLIGKDGRQTCVIVTLNRAGVSQRGVIVPRLERAVEKFCKVSPDELHMAGPVIDGLRVDEASQYAFRNYAPFSALTVFVLCWLCLGSVLAAALVFGVALLCQGISVAIIGLCGESMSALLIVMPPLIQVLAVAGGIHLINYYRDALSTVDQQHAAARALQIGSVPCSLSAVTTAIGLGSLTVSQLVPVQQFGKYAAAGVLITLVGLLALIPGLLLLRPIDLSPPRRAARRRPGWDTWVGLISRFHAVLTAAAVIAIAVASLGISDLKTSVRIETLFPQDSKILEDYRWLEKHIGPLVPVEVIVRCNADCPLSFSQRMGLVARLEEAIRRLPEVENSVSAADFLPDTRTISQVADLSPQAVEEKLAMTRPALIQANYLSEADQQQSFRITGFVSALADIDYGHFLSILDQHLDKVTPRDRLKANGIELDFTGMMPVVHSLQRQLLTDLYRSFLTAFLVITVIMTLVQAGFATAFVSMIPNVFPTLIVFGFLGWQQMPVDIGSVMTASVALGVAVDDTLHFLTFFRKQLAEGADRQSAVLSACQHCGRAMLQTTVICGLGLLVFSVADFLPTGRFAWMMMTLLVVAIVGDLVVLPALLIGPLGHAFTKVAQKATLPQHNVRQPFVETGPPVASAPPVQAETAVQPEPLTTEGRSPHYRIHQSPAQRRRIRRRSD